MRVLAWVLALIALAAAGGAGADPRLSCPHLAGSAAYVRAGKQHVFSLATCTDRVLANAKPYAHPAVVRSANGHTATITATRSEQAILVDGKPALRVHEDRSRVPGGIPGPLGLATISPDGRYVFYYLDPMSSASIAADGLVLRVLNVATGKTSPISLMLMNDDYWSWCGSTLALTAGGDRLATHGKHLVAARAPGWKPHAIWKDTTRAFGSLACAPDGRSVAVLSQRDNGDDWNFFATRWHLWRVGLDGSHTRLDAPPAGFADESPAWSPDGNSLLFVRERKGYGTLQLLHDGRVFGPLAKLGYGLGYHGHHDWGVAWRR